MDKEEFLESFNMSKRLIKESKDNFDIQNAVDITYSSFTQIFIDNQEMLSKKHIKIKSNLNPIASQYRKQAIDRQTPLHNGKEYGLTSINLLKDIIESVF